MKKARLIWMNKRVPGSGEWMGRALSQLQEDLEKDPFAETNGAELGEHLFHAFLLHPCECRYLFLIAVDGEEIAGHVIARIDYGYEGRRNCLVGFFKLGRGYAWGELLPDGHQMIEDWARYHGCDEIRISVGSQSHARLYKQPRYGGFKEHHLVMSRRLQ